MFKRIVYEEWMEVLPVIAFVLTFAVFTGAVLRALRMHKCEADRMAHLPVDGPEPLEAGGTAAPQTTGSVPPA